MVAAALGSILGGAGSLASALMQRNAQENANQIAWRNFYLQERLAREQMQLAKAGRTDALGNKVHYVPGVGWKTDATPQTRALLSATQRENLKRNTVDADLRRRNLQRNDAIRSQYNDMLADRLTEYRYGKRDTEASLTPLFIQQETSKNRKTDKAIREATAQQAARTGNRSAVNDVIEDLRSGFGDRFSDAITTAILRGKEAGQQFEHATRRGDLQEAGLLAQVAMGMDATPLGDNPEYATLTNLQEAAFGGMERSNRSASEALAQALAVAGERAADSYVNFGPGLAAIGGGLGKLGQGAGGGMEVAGVPVAQRQVGNAGTARGGNGMFFDPNYMTGYRF